MATTGSWMSEYDENACSKKICQGNATRVADVTEWKKVDNHMVKAILAGPNPDLPTIPGTPQFKIIKDGTTDFQNPVGTGPFRLKELQPGVRSIHVRNEHYWRDGPNVDEIEIFAITDKVARTSAFLSGDIDLMQALDPNPDPGRGGRACCRTVPRP